MESHGNADNLLTGACTPLSLNGKEYRASPLSDKDISELDEWVQTLTIRRAQAALTDSMSTAERQELLQVAIREASAMTWVGGHGARMLATVDGMSRLVWQMLKKEHRDLTPDFVRQELIKNPRGNIEEANRVFARLRDEEKRDLVRPDKRKGSKLKNRRGRR